MIRTLIGTAALLYLTGCVELLLPCEEDNYGGIGGTNACEPDTPSEWIPVNT